MATPRNTRKTSAGRLYEWRPQGASMSAKPEHYWSVTTILSGGIPKPALVGWGIKSVAEYAVANHRELTRLLDAVQLKKTKEGLYVVSDPDAVTGAIQWLKSAPYRERDRKANLGTSVHEHAEAYQKNKPFPKATPDVAPYVESFHQFLEDWKPRYQVAEAPVYNRTLKYAGTLDAISEIDGLRLQTADNKLFVHGDFVGTTAAKIVLDYKTGKGVYPEAALQLSAYRNAEFIGMPDGSEAPMPKTDGAAVVWLKPDGYELIPVRTDDVIFNSFRYAIEVFRFQEETSKTAIGMALPKAVAK